MWKWSLMPALLAAVSVGSAQTAPAAVDLANLREDVRGLSQRVADLSLRVDQLEAENSALREKSKSGDADFVTRAQLNAAIAELNRALQASVASSQDDTLRQVSVQVQRLARQPGPSPEPEGAAAASGHENARAAFGTDFPKEGINFTVQKGDTLALIAKKTGARLSDIINANKIADPSRIRAGQTLFIPGGK